MTSDSSEHLLGFNLIGHISGNLGLGASARQVAQLLLEKGHPVSILDTDPGRNRAGYDRTFDAYTVKTPTDLRHRINLAILTPHAAPQFFLNPPNIEAREDVLEPGHAYWLTDDRLNVAIIWWELTVIPKAWVAALELFDVVVAMSPFIRATLEEHLSNVIIIPAIHPYSLPTGIAACRERFGLQDDVVLFATSFEPLSDTERKNPFAAIEAFQCAFGKDDPVNLIVKLHNAESLDSLIGPAVSKLNAACAGDNRIRIINETFSHRDVLSLYASCDVFVSLHRSEGLGFGLMEAMALGKPVIATGWSGNLAYMDHTNSALVSYNLIPAHGTLAAYTTELQGEAPIWADPKISDAIAWMQKLANDADYRIALGQNASAAMARLQREARSAKFVDEICAISKSASFLPQRTQQEKLSRVQSLQHAWSRHQYSMLSYSQRTARMFHRSQEWIRPFSRRTIRNIRRLADRHVLWRFR